jgi:hypothetical protein
MFADMPLDNRRLDQFAAVAAVRLPQAVLKRRHGQNDLLFRPGRAFCNIGRQIRQYG